VKTDADVLTAAKIIKASKMLDAANVESKNRHYICYAHGNVDCAECTEKIIMETK